MRLSRTVARAVSPVAWASSIGILAGCPQMLDDEFTARPGSSEVGPEGIGGSPTSVPDAGAGPAGGGDPQEAFTELGPLLSHRYEFEGYGTTVLDSVGTAHGASVGVSLGGNGRISLSGDEYVDLPRDLISGFESVTIECWVNWSGAYGGSWGEDSAGWQSIFTFGTNDQGEGGQGNGTRYIYLTPRPASYYGDNVRAGFSLTGFNSESFVSGNRPLPIASDSNRGTQAVYVLDGASNRMALFIDGALEVAATSSQRIELSEITEVNNWLGRSQFLEGANFVGDLLDVRIYGVALGAEQVELSFDLGPDAVL